MKKRKKSQHSKKMDKTMATTITTAPLKIISGGQTGADLAALIAAKAAGLETGGTASEGFQTEMGANVDLRRVYGLTAEGSYKARTKKNVDDADATIVLLVHEGKGGAAKTIGWASNQRWECQLHSKLHGGYRPVMVLKAEDLEKEHLEESAMKIVQFVRLTGTRVLNVAGHRQSTAFMPEFFPMDHPMIIKNAVWTFLH